MKIVISEISAFLKIENNLTWLIWIFLPDFDFWWPWMTLNLCEQMLHLYFLKFFILWKFSWRWWVKNFSIRINRWKWFLFDYICYLFWVVKWVCNLLKCNSPLASNNIILAFPNYYVFFFPFWFCIFGLDNKVG